MWLQDFLPHDFPSIRVMSFGYDSRIVDGPGSNRIIDYAQLLLQELDNARDSKEVRFYMSGIVYGLTLFIQARSRPIIFLGHSLGGILIRQVQY
jgi:hypothetical protein